MHKLHILIFNILLTSTIVSCNLQPIIKDNFGTKDEKLKAEKQQKYPPCKSCAIFVDSFKKGLEKTQRGKHDGGDAHWEEQKLGSYKTSEVRLVEIQEMLCTDITRGEQQCLTIAEEHESDIEYWWKRQDEYPDFFEWFCIETLKVCCHPNYFGKDCLECTDCSGNGYCKGNGTRKGNGKCNCDKGYSGENCQQCSDGFYEAFKDESKLLCSQCHVACHEGCSGPGTKNCVKCKSGWFMKESEGCYDINECVEQSACPGENQFCVNSEGSYQCLECDKSCNGCDGDGPDMCVKCADGYELRDGMCTDLTNEKRDQYVTLTRYCLYLGLCVTVCIIFQNSTWLAAIFGIVVGVYISLSEYWLKTNPVPKSPSQKILEAAMGME
ncbi:CLUMA_CG016174, isoform A [Clunio marinus]|uniref:CLUMA_CG016174, isoform A n=1 Tax=Clunio marinus TaxID=568069 RepID=A0A1J1ITR9_9DIPT|nr:CLUMA_CG016174, isoform A [Clunio marinus]